MKTSSVDSSALIPAELRAAIDAAVVRIPPLWPLRNVVAVNPFLGLVDQPFPVAAALLERVRGAAPLLSRDDYRQALREGRIDREDLAAASDDEWTTDALIAELYAERDESAIEPIATVAEVLDRERPRAHWSGFVVDEISKWCAVTFDENQTTWNSPWKHDGLYRAWHSAAQHDLNPEAFGLAGFRAFVTDLPSDALAAIARCYEELSPAGADAADFFHRQLITVSGWAGYVQYLVREDALRGRTNAALLDLLAIRLAYDTALHRAFSGDALFLSEWRETTVRAADSRQISALSRWQTAYEAGYQRRLGAALSAEPSTRPTTPPPLQAIFCIDVRSEVFRRHLERAWPGAQTIGFAGFFGFPVSHHAAAATTSSALSPVLLVPTVDTHEPLSPRATADIVAAKATAGAWKAFQNSAASCFSFVESVGWSSVFSLGRPARQSRLACSHVAPDFADAPLATRAALAAGALRNMGLTRHFARLVLVCGHGSESANNPHASGLDCGACGGNAGDINARLAAATLNDPAVRSVLAQQGIVVPADTVFVAGLHNTTTDEVVLFDLNVVPETHRTELARLRDALRAAGARTRRERTSSLGLPAWNDQETEAAVRARGANLAEVRPEWGLANNAAFVAAPRSRTAELKLDGRVFLHDYDASLDPDDAVLTLILCAPVVVASWINLQYYASRIDPVRYGAGNKVLHNVVGGIGVLEGNGGDLKVGLPLQSIHNGVDFVHEPRRLAVYIEAEPERIDHVLKKNPSVRQLFDHGWLHLYSLQGTTCLRHHQGSWKAMPNVGIPAVTEPDLQPA